MDLDLSPQERRFREEVRAFLRDELTADLVAVGRMATSVFTEPRHSLRWQRILHARGWAAPTWPRAYGGPGWSDMERHIFQEECARAGAPGLAPMGLRMVGPCIMGFGTPEQKALHLPRILSGEDYWCQGYSEPGAGSDLAALQLRAVVEGDEYVLNGSKIWTTHAHHANRMFCLTRTRVDGPPQAGITFLLLDMAAPGIRVDPIITLAGEHEVNQVFFDDVRVPKANRLGEENQGWTVAKHLLEFERGGSAAPGLMVALERMRGPEGGFEGAGLTPKDHGTGGRGFDAGSGLDMDPALRRRFVETEIALTAMDMMERRVLGALASGGRPGPASSLLKIQGAEGLQRVDELGVDLAGPYAAADQPDARAPGANAPVIGPRRAVTAMARYLNDRAATIYGGSNEIQRDIIAKRVLGL